MEFKADGIIINKNYEKNLYNITFITRNLPERYCKNIKINSNFNVRVTKYYKKRSLDANAYCWLLCDKIAKKISTENSVITKEDVYKNVIINIGTFEAMIVKQNAYSRFKKIWENQGLGFLVQEISRKENLIKIHCYYGSSTYNTKEMSLLINLLEQEARQLDIEIKNKNEKNNLLKEWK